MARFPVLQIEPTDLCNLRCAMCGPHTSVEARPHGIAPGFMDLGGFEAILRALARERRHFDHVILQWMGEPLLHPAAPRLPGLVARELAGLAGYVRVDTNGLLLDEVRVDALLEAWLPFAAMPLLVVVGIDAATRETWRRVKRPPDGDASGFDRVRRNLRGLVDARRRAPEAPLHVQVQLVVQEANVHEIQPFLDYWMAFFACRPQGAGRNEILLKRLSVGTGGPAQSRADALYDRAIADLGLTTRAGLPADLVVWERKTWEEAETPRSRPPCPALWLTPVLRHDGHLLPCCADLAGALDLGSVHTAGFSALWDGPEMTRLRLAHAERRFEDIPFCAACGGFHWYELTEDEIQAWLSSVSRPRSARP